MGDIAEVIQEAGLAAVRAATSTAPLEEFVQKNKNMRNREKYASCQPDIHESPLKKQTSTADLLRSHAPSQDCTGFESRLARFRQHVEAGKDIHELSVGYPGLSLSYWVACPA